MNSKSLVPLEKTLVLVSTLRHVKAHAIVGDAGHYFYDAGKEALHCGVNMKLNGKKKCKERIWEWGYKISGCSNCWLVVGDVIPISNK
jgi:hypothetical protein